MCAFPTLHIRCQTLLSLCLSSTAQKAVLSSRHVYLCISRLCYGGCEPSFLSIVVACRTAGHHKLQPTPKTFIPPASPASPHEAYEAHEALQDH